MILLDTHVLVWWIENSGRLPARVSAAIMNALPALVSPITFWELTVLIERGRIALDLDVLRWSRDLLAQEPVEIAPITPSIAIGAARLTGFHGDPADRLLYATAREMSVPLISKDGRIQRYARGHADVKVVW